MSLARTQRANEDELTGIVDRITREAVIGMPGCSRTLREHRPERRG